MKALTLWQPWASLIIDGRKTIETRPKPFFSYWRGPVAIHAGLKVDRAACEHFGYIWHTIPRGAVLGVALVEFVAQFPHDDFPPDPYGDFTPGRFGALLKVIHKYKTPIPAKGGRAYGWKWDCPNEGGIVKNVDPYLVGSRCCDFGEEDLRGKFGRSFQSGEHIDIHGDQ